MSRHWKLHLALVALCAAVVGLAFLREPGFGDDLTYWSFAFDLHEVGLKAWARNSFHDLRWPVWGVCWLLQAIVGPGLSSYYGEPILYLIGGALLSFTFGRWLAGSVGFAWACALAFLFHPLLDTVCHRPMPDLSEGVWNAAAVLCWWKLVHARGRAASAGWAVLCGVIIYLAESNRLTGSFAALVLAALTLAFARRQIGWLLLAGAVAGALYVAEAAFYHQLFGDWLHNLHANLGGKGKKGTDNIPLLTAPFRFIDSLVKETRLSWFYAIFACFGLAWAWRHAQPRGHVSADDETTPPRPLGRVLGVWFVTLYLCYACAPQSLWPWRPVIRDADRFLAGLAIPMSVLAMAGLAGLLELARARQRHWGRWIYTQPLLAGAAGVLALCLISTRSFFNLGFVPEMRRYLATVPAGTPVFTHSAMREFVYLCDPRAAASYHWLVKNDILQATPVLEKLASDATEFWYARKLVWLNTRKRLEQKAIPQQEALPSYFDHPDQDWALSRLLAKGDTPDLVFYRRRTPAMPKPLVLSATAPEWGGIVPTLPLDWTATAGPHGGQVYWPIPPSFRGKAVRLEMEAASPQVQAVLATLRFYEGKKMTTEYVLKPYLHPGGGREFFVLSLPPKAEQCSVHVKFTKDAKSVHFQGLQASFSDEIGKPPP